MYKYLNTSLEIRITSGYQNKYIEKDFISVKINESWIYCVSDSSIYHDLFKDHELGKINLMILAWNVDVWPVRHNEKEVEKNNRQLSKIKLQKIISQCHHM